jgi:hypothetical protein
VADPGQQPLDERPSTDPARARISAARARADVLKRAVFDAYVAAITRERQRRTPMERLERAWLWILPWSGYLALLSVARNVAMPAVLTGWVLILVWQMFAIGAHDQRIGDARRNPWNLGWMLAPVLLFASQSWGDAGLAVANALIEITIVDVSALIVVLVTVMVLQPGEGKEMAWPGIIILGLFVACFLWAFVAGWHLINPDHGLLRGLALGSAFIIQFMRDWRWLRPLARGDHGIGDIYSNETGLGLILGQLALWLLLPGIFALLALL